MISDVSRFWLKRPTSTGTGHLAVGPVRVQRGPGHTVSASDRMRKFGERKAADEGNLGSVNVWRARSKQDGDDFRA